MIPNKSSSIRRPSPDLPSSHVFDILGCLGSADMYGLMAYQAQRGGSGFEGFRFRGLGLGCLANSDSGLAFRV